MSLTKQCAQQRQRALGRTESSDFKQGSAPTQTSSDTSELDCDETRLKEALKALGLKTKSNFMPYLDYYNVVEIYTLDGRQLYSNGRFFEVTSVPVAELKAKTFHQLFQRPADIDAVLQNELLRVAADTTGQVIEIQVPVHTCREASGERRLIRSEFLYATSLFDENEQLAGLIITMDAEVVPNPILRTLS